MGARGRGRKSNTSSRGRGKKVANPLQQPRLDEILKPRRSTRQAQANLVKKDEENVLEEKNVIILDPVTTTDISISVPVTEKKVGRSKSKQTTSKEVKEKSSERTSKKAKLTNDEKLELLKNFDLNPVYGPCRGVSRRSRFERALKFNLQPQPPNIIIEVLNMHQDEPIFQNCIWDQCQLLKPQF